MEKDYLCFIGINKNFGLKNKHRLIQHIFAD
jgi:hypothetical protein